MEVLSERYELRATLGVGGMAEVREAYDRLLDRRVAIKLLRSDLGRDPRVRERFLREARTAAQFTHSNAVTVFDTGVESDRPFIVMELVEGPTLAQRLADGGALDEAEAVRIADHVLAALAAAHREGFVHRDVKPANILLPETGVKLADFGIAKGVQDAASGLTTTGMIIGTPAYLSPEQVNGEAVTPASDVYGMGVVLYEMLAGMQPFTGDTPVAVAVAHTTRPVPQLVDVHPTVSAHIADVVARAMAKDPADRYGDAEQMRDALLGRTPAATAVLAPTAAAPTQSIKQRPFERRRRVPVVPLIVAAVLVLGALAYVLAGGDKTPQTPAEASQQPTEQQRQTKPATEAPQPTEPATEPVDTAPPDPREADDVDELIEILDANPDAYGTKQDDVRKKLEELQKQDDPEKLAEQATKLLEEVAKWAEEGAISPELAEATFNLVGPLTEYDEDEDDEGPGNGKAKGRDQHDD